MVSSLMLFSEFVDFRWLHYVACRITPGIAFVGDHRRDLYIRQVLECGHCRAGRAFQQSEAFSFQVATVDQEETDRYWNAIVGNGGQESMCGWCKDKWGVSWQITPNTLTEAFTGSDRAAAKRAFEAMMTMQKIDVAAIDAARRG